MSPRSRIDVWIEYEKNKEKVMKELAKKPLTRNEVAEIVGLTKVQIHNIIKNLNAYGFIKIAENMGVVCAISGRTMRRYTPTLKKFVPKDMTGMKERSEANKAAREKRVPRKKYDMTKRIEQMEKEEQYDKATKTVIKVNDHTTIYLNSKRPGSDYRWQRKAGARKHTSVSMQSGMNMFRNWE